MSERVLILQMPPASRADDIQAAVHGADVTQALADAELALALWPGGVYSVFKRRGAGSDVTVVEVASLKDPTLPSPNEDSPYWRAQKAVAEAHDRREALEKRHESERERVQGDIEMAVAVLRHLKAGTLPEVKEAAEKVVKIRYPENVHREDGPGAVRAAIQDVMGGARKLRHEFIGTKSYEGWSGQREDHKYGFGPRHGSTVFAIELKEDVRKRLNGGGDLTEQEIEAVVCYLTNLTRAESQ